MASNTNLKIKYLSKMALQKFTNGRPTQNVVLKCDKMQYVEIRSLRDIEFEKSQGNFVLLLD